MTAASSRDIPRGSAIESWPDARAFGDHPVIALGDRALSSRPENPTRFRSEIISIALIDEYSFTRESISRSLVEICNILNVVPFMTSSQCLNDGSNFDVILYHAHENSVRQKNSDGGLSCIKQLLPMAPVIILCDVDSFDLISAAFESGVRGYIPTESTSLEIAIEIMYLVKAGGTFVPPSSLSPQRIKSSAARDHPAATRRFTPRQCEVLDCLKLGQTNKSIAFILKMSESSVKTHIQNIMRKMGATNRTEVACLVQRLEMSGMQPTE
jgi:DNA-binding NarL/FixJ family response regulator